MDSKTQSLAPRETHEWFIQTKETLLAMEKENILTRVKFCEQIVNDNIDDINERFHLKKLPLEKKFSLQLNPSTHLRFLATWRGLKTEGTSQAPRTKRDYEKKSKNWLNGRRAPNYGQSLFPLFITSAKKYIEQISKCQIPTLKNCEQRELYSNVAMYQILANFCECEVVFTQQTKKTDFFCKNSIVKPSTLRSMLQSYAKDHQYVQGFPSCHQEANGFFLENSQKFSQLYMNKYLKSVSPNQVVVQTSLQTPPNKDAEMKNSDDCSYWRNKYLKCSVELNHTKNELNILKNQLTILMCQKPQGMAPYLGNNNSVIQTLSNTQINPVPFQTIQVNNLPVANQMYFPFPQQQQLKLPTFPIVCFSNPNSKN